MSDTDTTATDDQKEERKPTIDNRHLFRQLVVQGLYQKNYHAQNQELKDHEPDLDYDLELEFVSGKLARKLRKNVEDLDVLVDEIYGMQEKIDKIISELAPAWPLDQINPVDLQIMRLEIYEGFIKETVPEKVAIDEAIELARDFGAETNVKFVSGVLGNLYADEKLKKKLKS